MKTYKKSVLVIEDDHETRVALRACLEQAGYNIESAANGADALELLREITIPDFILLDLNMPIMNGEEFLKKIRVNPELNKIPVIQLSSETDHGLPGVRMALSKPVDLRQLLSALKDK